MMPSMTVWREIGAHAPVVACEAEREAALHQQLLLDEAVEHALRSPSSSASRLSLATASHMRT